jgi:hypothetical protein
MKQVVERSFEGRASLDELFDLEAHVRDCARCRELHEQSHALQEALAEMPAPPVERLDVERALAGIRAGIEAGDAAVGPADDPANVAAREERPAGRRALWLAAAAAAVVLLPGAWLIARALWPHRTVEREALATPLRPATPEETTLPEPQPLPRVVPAVTPLFLSITRRSGDGSKLCLGR